ncbi:unnamed protein product [Rotaria sp. Silwood1]|nr:unnamed protein product [Rotaria sp. Silwood1]CAF0764978.1 unnamed protein product [Rotaria sp. Silwood1]CAF3324904.1 unnamed protein product [Rotaria sp. Silwood1]CAF4640759.1 unnamed protein product [Rotaria sp. Silwood1]
MQTLLLAIIVVLLQQHIQLAAGVTCATNPCNLVPGQFDAFTGYCCYDIPTSSGNSVCTCPSAQPVVNGPCRTSGIIGPGVCNRTCVNGGVCNIVNGANVCWCASGFTGANCELQGIPTRCTAGVCQSGACVEQTLGSTVYAYCFCNPGWTGTRCDRSYFTCQRAGVFPDTAYCAIGRYYYCSQASATPIIAMCPDGQTFNRATSQCDTSPSCT